MGVIVTGSDTRMAAPATTHDFSTVYLANHRALVGIARAATGSWEAAEDLTHETFVKAWRGWDRIGGYDNPGAWLRLVLLHRVSSRWRSLGRERAALGRMPVAVDAAAADSAIDDGFWAAVATLPTQQRNVVLLHYADDQSVDDIAAVLGCSSGTVKTHLSRARQALATRLREGDAR